MRTRTNKRWTYSDLSFIRNNYPNMTQFQLAYHFKVSESVMEACIRRYGFKKYGEFWTEERISHLRIKYPVKTAAALAEEMNLPCHSVVYAIEKFRISKKVKPKKPKFKTHKTLCCSECGSENVIIKKELVKL